MPLVSVAIIVVTFAALEWREAHLPDHARARRRRRKWPAAGPPAHSCGSRQSSFVIEAMPGAVTYRISVSAFDVVSADPTH